MKINIKTECCGSTPKPLLTKVMFDWLWDNWWKVKNNVYIEKTLIETIEITISQVLEWTDYHFFIKVNGSKVYHLSAGKRDFDKFQLVKNKCEGYHSWGKIYKSRKNNFKTWVLNN